jgi:SAM-dependent methyltransferase
MKKLYSIKSSCRLCGSKDLELVVPLGDSPVSEKYLTKENLSEKQDQVPLDLYFCLSCTHVQLLAVVEPDFLWSDFTFKTSNNPALVEHFKDVANRIIKIKQVDKNDLIIDIGSNDGTLLQCFKDKGHKSILGVDPADKISLEATENGIPTITAYMNMETSNNIINNYGKASIITANNVYAHVDDMIGLTAAIKNVLKEDGIFVFEVSYLLDVVEKILIGTVFHEHLCYHSVRSLSSFLRSQDLELIHVERGPEQGGSIIGYAQHINGSQKVNQSVMSLINLENESKLNEPVTIRGMYSGLEKVKNEVSNLISNLKNDNQSVAGYGAARAGTTLLSYFGIGQELDFLVDDNKTKHYKFSPGDKLEVLPTSSIYTKTPDYLLILAWLHADKIIQSHKQYLDGGGIFLKLFPGLKQVKSNNS